MSDGDLFEKAIRHACVSGGLRVMSLDKRVESGLMRAADHHSRVGARLLNDWLESVGALSSCRTIR
jgi:hypothetical protein